MDRLPTLARSWADLNRALSPGPRTVVMTMGALHQGHLDLVDHAARLDGQVVVTIFVNPLQFGQGEDYETYPRDLGSDLAALRGRGVKVVYAPSTADLYPQGKPTVSVSAGPLGQIFEGAARPGHFDGVLTVVAKLLRRTAATTAVFGEKDAQQLALVRRMVADLDLEVQVVAVPTRRDQDGLATSSRNQGLDGVARAAALALPRALTAGVAAAQPGPASAIRQAARDSLQSFQAGAELDYLEVVEPSGFEVITDAYRGPALIIGALRVGQTRLIDNAPIVVGQPSVDGVEVPTPETSQGD